MLEIQPNELCWGHQYQLMFMGLFISPSRLQIYGCDVPIHTLHCSELLHFNSRVRLVRPVLKLGVHMIHCTCVPLTDLSDFPAHDYHAYEKSSLHLCHERLN